MNSYSGRVWFLPTERWAFQASMWQLNEAKPDEPGAPRIDVFRATASASYHAPVRAHGYSATTFVWGWNNEAAPGTNGFLLESVLDLCERHVFFGRAEVVGKTGEELVLDDPATCPGGAPLHGGLGGAPVLVQEYLKRHLEQL